MGEKITGIDWADVAKSQLIPPGNYVVRVDKVEPRVGQKTGNPYWNVELTIQQPEQLLGRKLWDVFMLDVQSLWKLRALCSAIGIELQGVRDFDSDELLQQEVGVVVITEPYEGEERNRVKRYFNLSTVTEEAPPEASEPGAPA